MVYKVFLSLCIGLALSASAALHAQKAVSGHAPIQVETPARSSGQKHVLQLVTPKLETVRIGIIGLGMRGPGAVERFTKIPGSRSLRCAMYSPNVWKKPKRSSSRQDYPKRQHTPAVRMLGRNYANARTSTSYILSQTGKPTPKWAYMRWSTASMPPSKCRQP